MKSAPLETVVQPLGEAPALETGKLSFIDNQIDAATGTITLKSVFPNKDDRLWPGQFVNVVLTLRIEPDALTIPAAAIQAGQNGSFVYVIKPDLTAEPRDVQVARTVDGVAVVAAGLKEGERVVIDGQLRLTNGTKVELRADQKDGKGLTS
jgi:multidrug efflux system membrane fusion protein